MDEIQKNSNACSPDLSCSHHQSLKLQTFISDLEAKLSFMKTLIEEDEKASSQRDEIHQNKKPALVQTLQELDRSYNSFAKEIYPSGSKSPASPPMQSSSPYSAGENLHPGRRKLVAAYHDPDIESSDDGPGSVDDDLTSTEHCNLECLAGEANSDMPVSDKDSAMKLYFSKLVEENLRQKEELLRRNEEKRSTINMLRIQLECLKGENRALHECLVHSPARLNRSRSQKIKGLFRDKLFKSSCSWSAC